MDFQHILDDLFQGINEARMHPSSIARKVAPLRDGYNRNIFKNQVKTREGVAALNNLIADLNQRVENPHRLKWSFALHMVADEQASVLGEHGIVTTEGSRHHRSLPDRIQEYAIVRGRISEVYEFGGRTAQEIIEELLIDDGLASRKRRNTLLDPIYKYIGIGCSYHEKLQACTVIILAEDIISLVAPSSTGKYKRRRGVEQGKELIFKLNEQVMLEERGYAGNTMGPKEASGSRRSHVQASYPSEQIRELEARERPAEQKQKKGCSIM